MNSFLLQARLYNGQGSLDALERFMNRHIWIIRDGLLAHSPPIEKLCNAPPADSRTSILNDIIPDPTIDTVVQGIAQVQSLQPDVMMGFGSDLALDATKATVWLGRQFSIEIETCVTIPTTSGTGSEVTSAYAISDPDKGIKYPLLNSALYLDTAILGPTLVVSVSPAITANVGMNVLTHALEAYVSTKASDSTDALAEKATQIVFQYLPVAASKGNCLATRGRTHNASTLSGVAFSRAELGINHTIVHQLGGQSHLPHGLANALLLTHAIYFNVYDPRAAKRYVRFAKTYYLCPDNAGDTVAPNALAHQTELLKEQCALPPFIDTLKDGRQVWSQRISSMIQAALIGAILQTSSRVTDANAMQKLLEELL